MSRIKTLISTQISNLTEEELMFIEFQAKTELEHRILLKKEQEEKERFLKEEAEFNLNRAHKASILAYDLYKKSY